jgi:hypothetical protein
VLAQIRCCHRGSSRCWRYSSYSRAKVVFSAVMFEGRRRGRADPRIGEEVRSRDSD